MTDRIEELERLQRLRRDGAITDAEFAREKEALLQTAPASSRPRPWLWVAIGAFVLGVVATVLFVLLRGNETSAVDASSQRNVAAPAAPTPPAPTEPTIRTRPEAEQVAAAFAAVFGSGRQATRTVDDNEYTYRPGGLTWLDNRAVLVSPGTNSQDCHACAGTLAIHYLEAVGDGFRVLGGWLTGGGFADWGRPPEWRFSTELSGRVMLRTEGGGGNQGVFCSGIKFYDFAPDGPREIADVRTGFSDSGYRVPEAGTPPTEVEGTIRNIVPGRSFDMVYRIHHFVLRGADFISAGNERVIEHYVLRGGHYVLSSGESRVPTC